MTELTNEEKNLITKSFKKVIQTFSDENSVSLKNLREKIETDTKKNFNEGKYKDFIKNLFENYDTNDVEVDEEEEEKNIKKTNVVKEEVKEEEEEEEKKNVKEEKNLKKVVKEEEENSKKRKREENLEGSSVKIETDPNSKEEYISINDKKRISGIIIFF
jgi:hypothetical protein